MTENSEFVVFRNDNITPGDRYRLEHSIYVDKTQCDISDLITLSPEKLLEMQEKGYEREKELFEKFRYSADELDEQMHEDVRIKYALQYVMTKPVEHTSNQWKDEDCNSKVISNMVYIMRYRIDEETRYDRDLKKCVPYAWRLSWNIGTNAPHPFNDYAHNVKIAGQYRKLFKDKTEMEKYLKGRIDKYSGYFKEISPPIPPELANVFKVSGMLLPGYSVAES